MLYRLVGDTMSSPSVPETIASVTRLLTNGALTDTVVRYLHSLSTEPNWEAAQPQDEQVQTAARINEAYEETEDQRLLEMMTNPLQQLRTNLGTDDHRGPENVDWDRVFGKNKTTNQVQTPTISFITGVLDKLECKFDDVTTGSRQDLQMLHHHASQVRRCSLRQILLGRVLIIA